MHKRNTTISVALFLAFFFGVVFAPSAFAASRTTPFAVGETTDPGTDAQPCGPTDTNCFPSLNALQPVGTTTGSGGIMKFLELLANGVNYIGFRAPDAISTNTIWTLPASDGLANTVLTTNGSGTLSWTNPSASGNTIAGFFTATSTTATSTFAGGLTIGTNKLVIDSTTGNVGIGTTSPYAKLSVAGEVVGSYFTATSTATSTFGGGLTVKALNITSTTATSTFANGINLSSGCFAVSGTCVTNSLGTNIITVGVNGQVQTLAAAIAARNAISHVSLAGPFNATITGTVGGSVDKRYMVADSGTPLSAIVGLKGDIGVRINGAGNPIIRANVINGSTLEFQAPIPKDFASVPVEVFDIVPVAIVLLPETHIRYDPSVSGTLTIPAFTTITALVPHTATIEMTGGAAFMFASNNTQNEIFFKDLNLAVSKRAINRIFWGLPSVDGVDNLQWMTTFGLYNCRVNSLAEDFVYFSGSGPAFYAKGNNVRGTYDVFRFTEHRKVVVTDNDIETVSNGVTADQGEPTPIVIGNLGTYVYPKQEYFISGNRLSSIAGALAGDTQGHAAAFEIRNQLSTNARVIISNNHLSAVVTGGADADGSIGVKVGNAAVGGTQNPYIEVSNNDLYVTNAGTGPVALYDGRGIGYTLTIKNNTVLPGSTNLTGQNLDKSITLGGALTVYGVGTSSPSGNVGIGTTSPYAKLSVVGDVVATMFNATSSAGYKLGGATLLTGSSTLANTFVGFGSGTSTTTGGVNTFIGYWSGQANTTGYANTANGVSSLGSNITGYNNTALGALSLFSNTSGWNNSAIGYQSLAANTSGYGNVAIGYIAQATNTTGYQNTSVGNNSLNANTTGYQNTGLGISALGANMTGFFSTAVGYNAGYSNTTGTQNTFLGSNAGYTDGIVTTPGALTNATAIGYNAQVTASNALILGGTGAYGVNVGIGTTSPYAKLSVAGNVVADSFNATSTTATSTFTAGVKVGAGNGYWIGGNNILANSSTAFLAGVGNTASTGNNSSAIGLSNTVGGAFGSNAFGNSNSATGGSQASAFGYGNVVTGPQTVAFGYQNTATTTDATALGYFNTAGGVDSLAIGNSNYAYAAGAVAIGSGITNTIANSLMVGPSSAAKLTILSSGYMGIGTTTPAGNLTIAGTAGQSANLFSIASSTGTNLLTVSPAGMVTIARGNVKDTGSSGLSVTSTRTSDSVGVLDYSNPTRNIGSSLTITPAADDGGYFAGNYSNVNVTGSLASYSGSVAGSANYVTNSKSSGTALNQLYGNYNWIQNGSGASTTNVTGVSSSIYNANLTAGTVTNAYGFYGSMYGGFSFPNTITNGYGLYLDINDVNITNPYAIYTTGTTRSYFGGNVGIGTTSPYAKLSVVGQVVADSFNATSTTATSTFTAGVNVGSTNGYFIGGNAVLRDGGMTVGLSNTNTAGGLGVAVGYSNTVSTIITAALGYSNTASGIVSSAVGINNVANNSNAFAFGLSNTASGVNSTAIGQGVTNAVASSLMIGPSDSSKMTILGSGNVGIGTSSPWAKLSVQNTYGNQSALFDVATTTSSGFATTSVFSINAAGTVAIKSPVSSPNFLTPNLFSIASSSGSSLIAVNPYGRLNVTRGDVTGAAEGANTQSFSVTSTRTAGTGFGTDWTTPNRNTNIQFTYNPTGDDSEFYTNNFSRFNFGGVGNSSAGSVSASINFLNKTNTGITNEAMGNLNYLYLNGGTTTNAYGARSIVYNNDTTANTLTNAYGMYSSVDGIAAFSDITNAYGVYSSVDSSNVSGGAYGFYSNITVPANNTYGFYSNGTAQSYFGGNVGIGTTSPYAALSVVGETVGSYFTATSTTATSSFAGGVSVGTNNGYFIGGANVLSLRGVASSNNTVTGATGNLAVGTGNSVTASAVASFAIGTSNTVTTITGGYAIGKSNTTSGNLAFAVGMNNTASGGASSNPSSAFGGYNTASGNYDSAAFGNYNIASGSYYASAFGYRNLASGDTSSAFGASTTASGILSSAFGYNNIASAQGSIAIGSNITNNIASSTQIGPSNTAKLTVLSTGQVGVGTTTTGLSSSMLTVASPVNSYGFAHTNGTVEVASYITAGAGWLGTTSNHPFYLYSNNSNGNLGISAAGLVGVGDLNAVTTPQAALHVARIGGEQLRLTGSNTNGLADVSFTVNGSGTLSISDSGTLKGDFSVNSFQKYGFGTTTPYATLSVMGSSTYPTLPLLAIASSTGQTLFTMLNSGLVGIGTTSPSAMLHIGSAASGGNVRVANGWLCVDNNDTCTGATTAGTIYSVAALVTGVDLAENYQAAEEGLTPGDIVSLSGIDVATTSQESFGVKRGAEGEALIGIVSTKPGFLLGNTQGQVPVALSGRVPLKVNLEHGAITRGDRLTISSVAGVGTKATATSSVTIATALEDFTSTDGAATGTILAFVNLEHNEAGLELEHLASFTTSDTMDETSFVGRVLVRMRAWFADAANGIGDFYATIFHAREVYTDKLCVGDVCVTQEKFLQMVEQNNGTQGTATVQNAIIPTPDTTVEQASTPGVVTTSSAQAPATDQPITESIVSTSSTEEVSVPPADVVTSTSSPVVAL